MEAVKTIETEAERELIKALAWMSAQYLTVANSDPEYMDSLAMSAGEAALGLLKEYGMVEATEGARFGTWTKGGDELLSS